MDPSKPSQQKKGGRGKGDGRGREKGSQKDTARNNSPLHQPGLQGQAAKGQVGNNIASAQNDQVGGQDVTMQDNDATTSTQGQVTNGQYGVEQNGVNSAQNLELMLRQSPYKRKVHVANGTASDPMIPYSKSKYGALKHVRVEGNSMRTVQNNILRTQNNTSADQSGEQPDLVTLDDDEDDNTNQTESTKKRKCNPVDPPTEKIGQALKKRRKNDDDDDVRPPDGSRRFVNRNNYIFDPKKWNVEVHGPMVDELDPY